MKHIVLLGDSIFDNAPYIGNDPEVGSQLQSAIPTGWKSTCLAVDGATTHEMPYQQSRVPSDATHLILSIGGNDALNQIEIFNLPIKDCAEALFALATVTQKFEMAYKKVLDDCLSFKLPLVVCTIYNGNFPDQFYQQCVRVAIALYNDVIIRLAAERKLKVIDLSSVCCNPEDYANPREPSAIGGEKIVHTILQVIEELNPQH
ncbi:MAG: SGNH/GDSL hydrolase family protein [Moraxellaceae bacterium]|nr:SGNH/GDSL hydrolase family protein [Moraxellaceae bacterium]